MRYDARSATAKRCISVLALAPGAMVSRQDTLAGQDRRRPGEAPRMGPAAVWTIRIEGRRHSFNAIMSLVGAAYTSQPVSRSARQTNGQTGRPSRPRPKLRRSGAAARPRPAMVHVSYTPPWDNRISPGWPARRAVCGAGLGKGQHEGQHEAVAFPSECNVTWASGRYRTGTRRIGRSV